MVDSSQARIDQLQAENQYLRAQLAALASDTLHARVVEPIGQPLWFDFVNDVLIMTDAAWQIQQWNRAAEQLYGWPRAAVLGRSVSEVIPVQHYLGSESSAGARHTLITTNSWRGEVIQCTKDRRELFIEASIHTLSNEHGVAVGYIAINRDITARVHAEAERQAHETNLRIIWDTTSDAMALSDADGIVRDANQAYYELYGYSPEQVINQSFAVIFPPEYQAMAIRQYRELIQSRTLYPAYESTIQRANGEQRIVELRASFITTADGQTALLSTIRDITARKLAEQALQASEERFRAIIENGSEGIILIDSDLHTTYVSPTVTQLLGYSTDVFGPMQVRDLCSAEDFPRLTAFIMDLRANAGATRQITTRLRHMDGSWRWMEQHGTNQLDNPTINSIIISFHDVTERVVAEQALQHSSVRLQILADASHAFSVAGADYHGLLGQITHIAAEQLGASCINCLLSADGQWLQVVTIYDGNPDVQELIQKIVGQQHIHIDDAILTARVVQNGEALFVPALDFASLAQSLPTHLWPTLEAYQPHSSMIVPLKVQETIIGSLAFIRHGQQQVAFTHEDLSLAQDLADRAALAISNARAVESLKHELAARQQAEHALIAKHHQIVRLKNEFMATMSHELRTPLTSVLGHSELLLGNMFGALAEEQRTSVKAIEQNGQHLLALINDILDYTRLENGDVRLKHEDVAVRDVCEISLQALQKQAGEKQIALTFVIDSDVVIMQTDAQRIRQILVNLLTNAVKFTPKEGQVGLEVRGDVAQEQVTFTVWDTGIGIAEADFGSLFEPFTQLDSSLSRQYEGTGLGLALVHRITDALGGGVSITSAVGQGSRFSVTLQWDPTLQGPFEVAQPDDLRSRTVKGHTQHSGATPLILLVEDRESNISLLQDALPLHGYRLAVARTGSEALAFLGTNRPDLILMDIQLPGMSGIQVIQEIRVNIQTCHLPIIALTALVMPGDRERCLAAGADNYLSKPVSLHILLAQIEELLAHSLSPAS